MYVYRKAEVEERGNLNYIPAAKDWGFPTDIHDADCPACLRGRVHSVEEHEAALRRARA